MSAAATYDCTNTKLAQVAAAAATAYLDAETTHLVPDKLNIHWCEALADLVGAGITAEVWHRFTAHYPPTHGEFAESGRCDISVDGGEKGGQFGG